MDLKQLKSLVSIVENNTSISLAAAQLNLVQSAVSQQISRLEEEIGVKIFIRTGKRLSGITPAGEEIVAYAYRTLANANSILEIAHDSISESEGMLRLGATHTQAQYILPPVIKEFSLEYPDIELQIHQGTPKQLVNKAIHDEVDFSICTEALGLHPDLLSMPSYNWNRSLIALKNSPILENKELSLKILSNYPIVTYVHGFTGREVFNETFKLADLKPQIVLSAADTDVIKTYVRNSMGVGVIANMTYLPDKDSDLELRDLSHLFPAETTKIAYKKDKYLRKHQHRFIELFQKSVLEQDGLLPPR
jgi:LysR family cys regulon transcriptional activator